MKTGARGGFTLVEVAVSSAIVVIMTLALMEGIVVSAKISHENAELLAADAFAWDTAWKWMNKSYDDIKADLHGQTVKDYDSSADAGMLMTSNDCPELVSSKTGGNPRVVVRVEKCADAQAISRHGKSLEVLRIGVDVEWGPSGDRKCLNGLCGADIANYSHPVTVYKSTIDRGTLE
ncbi:MAG: type II secretion system protein [Kiritimatiellae bacterium]|nr:type II secretion system protein [Kiritimatiellia bacterium]